MAIRAPDGANKGLLCLYILKKLMVTSTDQPTNQQGEYRAICLFQKLENRKKAEICNKVGHPLFSNSNNTSDTSNTRNAHVKQVFTSNTSNTIIASNAGDASYSSDASKTSNARCKSLNASQ